MFVKHITYDRDTKDYALYLDGELVGYARTWEEGLKTLDQLAYTLLQSGAKPKSAA